MDFRAFLCNLFAIWYNAKIISTGFLVEDEPQGRIQGVGVLEVRHPPPPNSLLRPPKLHKKITTPPTHPPPPPPKKTTKENPLHVCTRMCRSLVLIKQLPVPPLSQILYLSVRYTELGNGGSSGSKPYGLTP